MQTQIFIPKIKIEPEQHYYYRKQRLHIIDFIDTPIHTEKYAWFRPLFYAEILCKINCVSLDIKKLEVIPMKASETLGKTYLNADKIRTEKLKDKKVTISTAPTIEKMRDGEEKICIVLKETKFPFILNATNTKILIEKYGDETDDWKNKTFTFRIAKVNFNGEMKDGIQIDAE